MSRYDLLPNKPRVDDRRVLNGIFWVLRSGAPWRDLPERYGPRATCYNRFVRWQKGGVQITVSVAPGAGSRPRSTSSSKRKGARSGSA